MTILKRLKIIGFYLSYLELIYDGLTKTSLITAGLVECVNQTKDQVLRKSLSNGTPWTPA